MFGFPLRLKFDGTTDAVTSTHPCERIDRHLEHMFESNLLGACHAATEALISAGSVDRHAAESGLANIQREVGSTAMGQCLPRPRRRWANTRSVIALANLRIPKAEANQKEMSTESVDNTTAIAPLDGLSS